MARIGYWSAGDAEADAVAVAEAVRARRGGRLLNIDRVLLHSPPATRGWGALLGAVRNEFLLTLLHRELLVCAVAALTDAAYELHHHRPLLAAAGARAEQMEALADVEMAVNNLALFDEPARSLIAFAIESTRNVHVSDACWASLRASFPDERALVEIVLVVGAYNMVSRLAAAVDLEVEGPAP